MSIPNRKNLPKTRQMWWYGFPPSVRGTLWEYSIANQLNITQELFQIFGTHAKQAREKKGETIGKEKSVHLIPLDLGRTFPALSIFQKDGPCHQQLRDVLEAYVMYRPDTGYVRFIIYSKKEIFNEISCYRCRECLILPPYYY
jgi:hypothetical protein